MMPIEHIEDWEMRIARQDAFLNCEIIDRPCVNIAHRKLNPDYPFPTPKQWASKRDRWMDTQYIAEEAIARVMNTKYLGDMLPQAYPNLGPEVFSAFFGCELEFSTDTSWSIPILEDWSQADNIQFSEDNYYWKKINEITDALLEAGKGKFYTGITDLHPGGDAIVAFRDPLRMNLDMIDHPEDIKKMIDRVTDIYFRVYDYYYNKLTAAGQPCGTWIGITSSKKFYVPSNDFSCMISKKMFDDVFLPGIIRECQHMEAAIYHLDGPDALQHLDSLLDVKEINTFQWVYGSGNGRSSDWMHIYKRCQAAGKGLHLALEVDEIDFFMENLRPEGLWLWVFGTQDIEHAEAIIKKISTWK